MAYLSGDTNLQPLVGNWYAWCHLLAPAPLAMNLAHRYLGTIKSFIRNPQVHGNASRDPSMFGGPFVSLSPDRLDDVVALQQAMERDFSALLAFAGDVKSFNQTLQQEATGHSLDGFYDRLPQSLKGCVELLYDNMNQPRIRFIEELMTGAEFSSRPHQSLLLSNQPEEERDFFLSTPRLPQAGQLLINAPFADPRLDMLARMRTAPADAKEVASALELSEEQARIFSGLCSDEAPKRNSPDHDGGGVRIRYFGHACVMLQTRETTILIDPLMSSNATAADRRFSVCDLPDKIDYVIITHGHQDHLVPEILLQIRHKVDTVVIPRTNSGSLVDPSLKLMFRELGFEKIVTLDPFDEIGVGDGKVVSIPFPGEHCDLDIYSRQGLFVRLGSASILFLVDSHAVCESLYDKIRERIGPVDTVFVGMECDGAPLTWLYGPLMFKPPQRKDDESRCMSSSNADQAFAAIRRFDCKEVYVYAMGQEPWLRFIMGLEYAPDSVQLAECEKLAELCREAGMSFEKLDIAAEMIR